MIYMNIIILKNFFLSYALQKADKARLSGPPDTATKKDLDLKYIF